MSFTMTVQQTLALSFFSSSSGTGILITCATDEFISNIFYRFAA